MRDINWDAPLTEDDKKWLRDRDRHKEIALNEARFSGGEDLDDESNEAPDYDKWSSAELKAEAETRGIDLTGLKKKAEVAVLLREDDQKKAAAEAEGAGE